MNIFQDKPITSINDDLFGRKNLVELIANSINKTVLQNHPCMVYGIYGKWGEGKTSLINLIDEQIYKNEHIKIVHYNPWMINGQEALLAEFFRCLSSSGIKDKVKDLIIKYGGILSFVSSLSTLKYGKEVSAMVGNTLNLAINTLFSSEKPLHKLKKELSESIIESEQHLVVFIDDIDRLDNDETHAIFQLVRQVADFDNTIYLLAMDPDVVSRSLSCFYGNNLSDGTQFLEKIIQIPILLPVIQERHIRNILSKKHAQLFSEFSEAFTKENKVITDQLSQLFSTGRQIYRYANQLSFVLPNIYQEVNIGDLCILEAIKSINVRAYNRIYTSKSFLLREKDPVDYNLDKAKELSRIETDYQSALEYIVEDINVPFKGLVKTLIDNIFRIRINQNPLIHSLIDLRYLCTNIYFNVYFIQSVPEGVISQQVINSIFTGFDGLNDEELGIWLKKFIEEYDDGEMQRAIISIIRQEKDLEKRAKITTRWIKLLSNSSIAQRYNKNSLSIGIDLCTFINSVLISDYLVTEIDRDHKKYDYPLITQIVDCIMKCHSIDFAMAFNAVVSNYDYTGFLNQDKSYIIPLVSRFLELPYCEQIKYSKFVLVEFFKRWFYFDQQAPSGYLLNLLNDPSFEARYFVEHLIDVNDSKRNVQEVTDFITFFNESIEAMFNNNYSNSEFNESKSIKYLKSNFSTVMMNNRQREIGV